MARPRRFCSALILGAVAVLALSCSDSPSFDPAQPARGPGSLVGNAGPVTAGVFEGGDDAIPEPRAGAALPEDGQIPDCDQGCRSYCEGLDLSNPVNRGLCTSLWGMGLEARPVVVHEACRRLHVDMLGRFPTRDEVRETCEGRSWGAVVHELMDSPEFVLVNQRRWSDRLLYNTRALSVERIFDMDDLVGKLYRGKVSYDEFAAVTSAHPVLTRRHDTPGDRAGALFDLFMGRPPLGHERSDMARLYVLWHNGYYDHPQLGMRLSDSNIQYRCVDEDGEVDPASAGECTSVLYGFNELILRPDLRALDNRMWSGLLRAEEWHRLQLPGYLLSQQTAFWEKAVDDVIEQYLGYELGTLVPDVRDELVRFLLRHEGDIRAVHFALATSVVYLQSSTGASPTSHRWTFGPLKQVESEVWLDTIKRTLGYDLGRCDHRISEPGDFMRAGTIAAIGVVENSRWVLDGGEVRLDYRDLARNLGGCPVNDVSGRFKIVSILTTAMQLNFVNQVCNPMLDSGVGGASIEQLLPADIAPGRAVTPDLAEAIVRHQVGLFNGRQASAEERQEAREHGETCERELCRAEEFARPVCFGLLSSSEMLFY